MTIERNAEGCLLGLACGDALGRPVEFMSAEEIESRHGEVTEMLGHGTHGEPPGTIIDDTEMALCVAESIVDLRGFDPADVADRFVDWLDSGPFDIGLMTRDSLSLIRQGASWMDAGSDVWESRPEGSNAGNGSVMRCAPHAIDREPISGVGCFRQRPRGVTQFARSLDAIFFDRKAASSYYRYRSDRHILKLKRSCGVDWVSSLSFPVQPIPPGSGSIDRAIRLLQNHQTALHQQSSTQERIKNDSSG